MPTAKQLMVSGEPFLADDELLADYERNKAVVERFNAIAFADKEDRRAVLEELFADIGDGVTVMTPLQCDYGEHVTIGARTFINHGCVMLSCARITIGAACQIASNVQLLTATHPVDPQRRRDGWEYAKPITLGDNVWLGGGVIVCPGVTIGENTVVGAGSVVVRDLPANVVAVGNPAKVQREITSEEPDGAAAT